MANLSLYCVSATLILDTDGNRILAKYYKPPHGSPANSTRTLHNLKEQRAFEKGLFDKTKKAGGDVILYDTYLVTYRHSLDLIFYFLAPPSENELMVSAGLQAFFDATQLLLRHSVEKRTMLENLDLVLLGLDETVDDGIILETDPATIAGRVSRPKADTTDIVLNEQTLLYAYNRVKEGVQQRISAAL
ncbi:putative RET3-coatomer complex zeta chain [Calocera cornea HHB12733]|uniref:Coatomer subunit zeta n=1 Tax=Calocera cornea HHB12733 TaxID=1353952 RepID=A0A165H3H1_9BASI|nr:putative RET3-coatomer complex zeta chain [Calocera cornea HHB12733]